MTTQWIIDKMEEWAPEKWAIETDNVGLIVGDRMRPVSRILTALDLSEDVLREAVQGRYDFVITHHPLISRHTQPINRITTDNVLGKKLMTLIGNGIGLYCAHTNLDAAPGGVNDLLFDIVGLIEKEPLLPPTKNNFSSENNFPTLGLSGYLKEPMKLSELAANIAKTLNIENILRYVGPPDMLIHKAGLCSGGGTALLKAALEKNCDVFISGDIGYHMAMDTIESGMALIDGTHYATEIPIAKAVADYLKKAAKHSGFDLVIDISQVNGQVFRNT